MRRILVALVLLLSLSPGLLWRSDPPPADYRPALRIIPLSLPEDVTRQIAPVGPVITGAWRLTSNHAWFGSYSALIETEGESFLAFSDDGATLQFAAPHASARLPRFGRLEMGGDGGKVRRDVEAATRDPQTGHIWIALEGRNEIIRLDRNLAPERGTSPAKMAHWKANGGPEAMVRLADGRFVVLAESALARGVQGRPGLVFASDPVEGGEAAEFGFTPPTGYWPSDMAQLPDGRVLILLRGIGYLPPRFTAKLVVADPTEIRAGADWRWHDIGTIAAPFPVDNFEGLAISGGKDGAPVTIWLISDSNNAVYLQETLLMRLDWQVPAQK